jgi:hypothetical protein
MNRSAGLGFGTQMVAVDVAAIGTGVGVVTDSGPARVTVVDPPCFDPGEKLASG